MYTGVTSVTGDQSIVGFVLMNQRTKETKFYSVTGAVENSAMGSAEGQVQNLGYRATFPLLLNISDQPTYFLALKDDSGLVKKYALVNVQKYQIVAIGDTVSECQENYAKLLATNDIGTEVRESQSARGIIEKMVQVVVEGNTHFYIMLEGDENLYDVNVAENLDVLRFDVGDRITIEYTEGVDSCIVSEIK